MMNSVDVDSKKIFNSFKKSPERNGHNKDFTMILAMLAGSSVLRTELQSDLGTDMVPASCKVL